MDKSKLFIKQYIPIKITKVVKPELIIWENLDFVNRELTSDEKSERRSCLIWTNILLTMLAFMIAFCIVRI